MVQSTIPASRQPLALSAAELEGDLIQPGHRLFGIVWINPGRMSGAACFAGTRIPLRTLFDYLEGGSAMDEFFEDFPGVSREQAEAVIELAAQGLFESLPRP